MLDNTIKKDATLLKSRCNEL